MTDTTTKTPEAPKVDSTPLPETQKPLEASMLENLPAPIAGIIRRTKERLNSVFVEKPKSMIQTVMDTMAGFRDRFMKSGFATTLGLVPTPETPPPAPIPTPEIAQVPEAPSGDPYEEADKKRITDFEEKALDSFVKISKEVSPNKILRDPADPSHSDPKNLNTVALQRLKQIKEMPTFKHPDENFLTQNGYAENISRVYINDGKDIAKDFMDSEVHRRNMLGSHTRLGVAMEMAFDQEKQKYFYYVVAIYAGGKSIPKDQKLHPVPLPDITSGESGIDVLAPYFEAFDRQTEGKIKHELDVEMTKIVDEKLAKEGETKGGLIYKLSDESGKIVVYGVRKHPPFLTRDENGKKVVVLFKDLADDFAKAPDARGKEPEQKAEQVQPVQEPEFAGHA